MSQDVFSPIRVVFADDYSSSRAGIRTILETDPALTIAGQASNYQDLTTLLKTLEADVVVLDLGGMGVQPITAVTSLARNFPDLKIVIFSADVSGALTLLRAGAVGYVAKEDEDDSLIQAVKSAARNLEFLSPGTLRYLERTGRVRKSNGLAPKELEVLNLVAEGLKAGDIAERMGIGKQTVSNYIHNLYSKTGCKTYTQLAEWNRKLVENQV